VIPQARVPTVADAGASCTGTYHIHGVNLTLHSDPAFWPALHARLGSFSTAEPGPVDVTFEVVRVPDAAQHVVAPPESPSRPVYRPTTGDVLYVPMTDELYINYQDRARVMCSPQQSRVRVSVTDAEAANEWLVSHPLLTLPLVELLKYHALYSLHAAGLCRNGQALLLAGGSGAGKTTLTLALLRAGFGFLGDDLVFFTTAADGLQVLAFPDEIDVTATTAAMFPELRALVQTPLLAGWPKRRLRAEAVYGVPPTWQCRPAALVFPRVAHADRSALFPISSDAALREVASNVLLTAPAAAQAHLTALRALVANCRCYRLETGRDMDDLPRLLGRLLG
jgi:hypothetical protein